MTCHRSHMLVVGIAVLVAMLLWATPTPLEASAAVTATVSSMATATVAADNGNGGDDNDPYFGFVPQWVGAVDARHTSVSWRSRCFAANNMTLVDGGDDDAHDYKRDNDNDDAAAVADAAARNDDVMTVVITSAGKSASLSCVLGDAYLLGDRVDVARTHIVTRAGAVRIPITDAAERAAIRRYGLQAFEFEAGVVGSVVDVVKTLQMWLSGTVAVKQRDMLQMLRDRMNWRVQRQHNASYIGLPDKAFQSGDQLAILKLEPPDMIIMVGSGSRVGHVASFLWMTPAEAAATGASVADADAAKPRALYVVESCGESCVNQKKQGVQATPWLVWRRSAQRRGFNVAWLPLDDEHRARFDERAAVRWFMSVAGTPYGIHNFLFGLLDTRRDNIPPPLTVPLLVLALPVIDTLLPTTSRKLFLGGFNHRLGTAHENMRQVYATLQRRNMTLPQLWMLPERDAWRYNGRPSMVCNVFWTRLCQEAGVFGSVVFQATEFTPVDSYGLRVFRALPANMRRRPQQQTTTRKQQQPFVQLFGEFTVELPGFNTVAPHAHMAETCPSMPPLYKRPRDC